MMFALPAALTPPPPFPLVTEQSLTTEFVAPGVRRGTYRLQTTDGPLVINVVAIDAREPSVRFGTVVAHDRLVSAGETVSSMAKRTGAVAGVNADYFDIGNTNQPLNLVVKDGALLRTPSKRVVFDVRTDRSIHFENVAFSGHVRYGDATLPLTAVNEWPPQGGVAYLTSAYGALKAMPGITLTEIVPAGSAHVAERISGSYRVASVADATAQTVRSSLLAFGPAAKGLAQPPAVGDAVLLDVTTEPPLGDMTSAVGGGPLLVANGGAVDDPNAPAGEERERRFPVSGAASTTDGALLLTSVDGRSASTSIGVTRPQFAALMLGLGAKDGMAFDSGGSATLVARVLGESAASVLGAPSDGEERPVGDGFFVYSDAPKGPPAQLVVRPSPILALQHATIRVHLAVVDAAGHALGPAHAAGGDIVRAGVSSSTAKLRAARLTSDVPIEIVARLTRLDVGSDVRNPNAGDVVHVHADGFDERGRPVQVGSVVRWRVDRGRISAPGIYRAARRDARIVAEAGGVRSEIVLRVGRHRDALPLFDAAHARGWRFESAPPRSSGGVLVAPDRAEMTLAYDLSGGERAAYANGAFDLPGEPQAFGIEVEGDGGGVGLRATFVNRFGERRALTLARAIDWNGWRPLSVRLPDDLNPPVQLVALYVVDALGNGPTHAAGKLSFRNPSAIVAGTP